MFNDYSALEKNFENKENKIKKKQDASRSLGIYIDQLKFHFELNDKDIINILNALTKKRKENTNNKWWQIWR